MRLTADACRHLMVAAQGLDHRPARRAEKADLVGVVRRLGALQIDTIHVVARSPYLVLWSRLGDYEPRWLDELLAEGVLFEQWAHEASLLPIEDYPLHRRLTLDRRGHSLDWTGAHQPDAERVIARIREGGPVRSADFARVDGHCGGWWDWKPEKRALEMLFAAGDLMVARRQSFQRVYDLRERVLPSWDDANAPSTDEAFRQLALKAVRALGVATAGWLPDYFRTPKAGAALLLESLADAGEVTRVEADGLDSPAYVHRDNLKAAESAASGRGCPELTTLLSPFDPLVWDRRRVREAFGFAYTLECYTPAEKRRYGYFSLPILRRGELVGRLDPKAHRRDGLFEVKSLHLEPGVALTDELVADVAAAIGECASWHRTPEVVIRRSEPPEAAAALAATLAGRS